MFLFGNKFYIIFISIWIIGLYAVITTFQFTSNNDKVSAERIEVLQNEIDSLRQRLLESHSINNKKSPVLSYTCKEVKDELKRVKRQLKQQNDQRKTAQNGPGLEYEQLRRKIETQARELSYFTMDQLNKISEKLSDEDKLKWNNVIQRVGDQSRVLLAAIRNITNVDGYQSWRMLEHDRLSKLIQARLNYLQNPSEPCINVKRLTCDINKGCGYGCEIHHAMHCFHLAYALGRPLILLSVHNNDLSLCHLWYIGFPIESSLLGGWRYNPGGFDQIFQPPSVNCTNDMALGALSWANHNKAANVVKIPLIDDIHPRVDFMPMAIPEDLSERLIRLHGNPFVWFTGQLMKYLLRPQEWLLEYINKKSEAIQFETPVVGVHVRRTDKVGTEAAYHDLSEYMKHVEDYYIIYQYQNPDMKFTKRVYLATDDPTVFNEAKTKYPGYIFYGDTSVAQSAQLNIRYGSESLKGVLLDIHFLSLSDYLVCTFSSQICRVAYEIMQQRVIDGAWRVQPLDDVYYFGGQNPHNQRAFISHKNVLSNEFSFERGDTIGTEGNHWNGFSKGSDKTNGQTGLYPSYKVEEIVNIAQMYTYPKVQISENE